MPLYVPTVVQDSWHCVGDLGEPALQNGITRYGDTLAGATFGDCLRFTRDRACVVWIEGLLALPTTGSSSFSGQAIFQLPPGYRPSYQLCFSVPSNNGAYQIGVDPSGVVYIQYGPGTASAYLSIEGVSFIAEDGPNPPAWTDLAAYVNTANGWRATSGTWSSTYSFATGAAYQGARYCIDAAGDVHFSGMVSNVTPGQTTTSYLTGLTATGLNGNIDTDFNEAIFAAACAGVPGFARQDVFSSGAIQSVSYGNNTATSGWISLDNIVFPGANNPSRWASGTLINTWTIYGASFPTVQMRMNKFGTVYLRGLIKGTAGTVATANPSFGTSKPGSPNIQKVFLTVCTATAGTGVARSDVLAAGIQPGISLFTAQAAGTATTAYLSLSGLRWTTKRYDS